MSWGKAWHNGIVLQWCVVGQGSILISNQASNVDIVTNQLMLSALLTTYPAYLATSWYRY